jgi:hypothetical protein
LSSKYIVLSTRSATPPPPPPRKGKEYSALVSRGFGKFSRMVVTVTNLLKVLLASQTYILHKLELQELRKLSVE